MQQIGHWIDGANQSLDSARTAPVFDPATGKIQAEVALASRRDVDSVVQSGHKAWSSWRQASLSTRAEVLFSFRHLLAVRSKEVASAITAEHGKVPSDAAGEVARGLENVEFACGVPALLKGGASSQVSNGVDVHSIRQPLGVIAGITPFNFPAMVPLWMLAGAIACGNSFILKPSEKDPSAALILAELLTEAGLPPGVFNVLQGDQETVEALLEHPDVAALSFVGSTPVARSIYTKGAAMGKRVQALGGAKNHMVVLPDADLDVAADAVVGAACGSAGERCMAISVLVAVGDIADDLVAKVASRFGALIVGPGSDPASEMGPLISAQHRDRVASYVGSAAKEGATVVVDGSTLSVEGHEDGFFFGPTLLDHVQPGMSAYEDEIFGPVLSVVRVASYEEALRLVNTNRYGNGTAIFTADGEMARRFQTDVVCGMVGVNVPIPVPVASFSFGGWKESMFGDAHMYGPSGLDFFTRTKVVTTRWPSRASSRVDLGFPLTR